MESTWLLKKRPYGTICRWYQSSWQGKHQKNSIYFGIMLDYSHSVDKTMLRAINEISRVQSKTTKYTKEKDKMLLDYAATYPNSVILYKAIKMVLHVDSYATYLTMLEARSFYSGKFYLSDRPSPWPVKTTSIINDTIYTEYKTICNVVSSSA